MSDDALAAALAAEVGHEALVDPAPYGRDGVAPRVAVRPWEEAQVAAILRLACKRGATVVPWGGGTRQHHWPGVAPYDVALDLTAFDQVEDFEPANLSVTCGAGMRLPQLNAMLAERGLFCPLAPPERERCTLGGTVVTASSGSNRLRYRTPREWLLGARVAFADGSATRFGGKLMKNVAGYDLNKLLPGSWGTLLVATHLTLRVVPIPERRRSLLVAGPRADVLAYVERTQASRLQPTAVDALLAAEGAPAPADGALPRPPFVLLACEDVAEAVERQARELTSLAAGLRLAVTSLEGADEAAAWSALDSLLGPGWAVASPHATLRFKLSVPASRVPDMVRRLDDQPGLSLVSHVCVGVTYALLGATPLDDDQVRAAAHALRDTAADLGGFALLQTAPRAFWPLASWPPRDDYALMRALKRELDPTGVLSPGRTPGG